MDVLPSTVVASTFKALEIGDLRSRHTNYTNQFKLPKTPSNLRVLDHPDNVSSLSSKPYIKMPARVVQGGFEIIPRGIAFIESCETHFNVSIHSGSFGFFDTVGEKSLIELDMKEYDFGSVNNIVQLPFIANEALDESANPIAFSSVGYAVPYKQVLEKIISSAGYEKTGSIFANSKFGALYLGALGMQGYNSRFSTPKEFEARVDPSFVLNASSTATKVNFTDVISDADGWYDGTNTYSVEDPQGGDYGGAWFLFNVYATIAIEVELSGASGVDIQLFSNTGVYTLTGVTTGTYQLEISDKTSGPVAGAEGTQVYMTIRTTLGIGTATVTFTAGHIYNKVVRAIAPNGNIIPLSYISVQGLLPDYPQKELLRHFMIAFGVFFRESEANTIEAKTLTEIIQDRANAVDWTSKRDTSKQEKVLYALNSYAQENKFRYSTSDDLVDDEYAQGILPVENANIENERDFYTTDFNSTATVRVGNTTAGFIDCAKIPIDPGAEEPDDPGLRLLLLRSKRSYEPTLSGGLSSYLVAYFDDALAPHTLKWQSFIDENYSVLINCLKKVKVVTRHYRLTPSDITTLDLFRLVYDDGHYYLINEVENYVPDGSSTKVTLFKVS